MYRIKLIHCGNVNIARPGSGAQRDMFFMPMGLFPIAGLLKENSFDVEIIHLDLEAGQAVEDILDLHAIDAVGMDLHWISQAPAVLDTAALLKSRKPDLFIFLGGFSASFFARDILRGHPCIDAVIRGDGEVPALELCRFLAREPGPSADFSAIPNLAWRDSQNNPRFNPVTYVAAASDMEALDFAAVDLLRNWDFYRNLSRYWSRFEPIKSQPLFFLEIGRGCAYTCLICGGNAKAQSCMNNRKGQAVRSVQSVIDTVKKAMTFGYRCFFSCFQFHDSDTWYIDFFKRLKHECPGLYFGYESWGLPSKQLIDALSHAFPYSIVTISPDSADQELRRRNKDPRLFYDNAQLEEMLEYIGSKGNVFVQLYFAYFLPGDTQATVTATLNAMARYLSLYGRFTEISYLNISADPGSSIYSDPGKHGMHFPVHTLEDYLAQIRRLGEEQDRAALSETVMLHPTHMQESRISKLTILIRLFNALLVFFPEPLAALLNECPSTAVLVDYLHALDLSPYHEDPVKRETAEALLKHFHAACGVRETANVKILFEPGNLDQDFDFE
jgi:radical SAM superfamily enzyme YgiQ (UPF0313 family)